MATAAKNITRALPHNPSATFSSLRLASRKPVPNTLVRQQFSRTGRRNYSSGPSPTSSSSATSTIVGASILAALAAGGFYAYHEIQPASIPEVHLKKGSAGETAGLFTPTKEDYQKVYDAIAKRLWEKDDYDDGSYGPVLVRLAWHASGTYDAETGTGGSNGATMRFAPEGDHGANAGLKNARDFLEPVKQAFPWISYSDLWTLAGVVSIQEMQGPIIQWRPGRQDRDVAFCTPDGRLPDGAKGQDHIRAIFGRMGFNDQEMVALSGAHSLGRCHTDRSGFDGPWSFSPTVVTNEYFRLLMDEKWGWRNWGGPKQYQDKTKTLMMLPSDMALIKDKEFRKYVEKYAKDSEVFFKDFSAVITKLFELGVPFKTQERMEFKPTQD